jgi:hypothetical protein
MTRDPPSGGGSALLTWDSVSDADGYEVGWNTTPASFTAGEPYPNRLDVGTATSVTQDQLTGIGTGVRYFALRSYNLGVASERLYGAWSSEIQKTVA